MARKKGSKNIKSSTPKKVVKEEAPVKIKAVDYKERFVKVDRLKERQADGWVKCETQPKLRAGCNDLILCMKAKG